MTRSELLDSLVKCFGFEPTNGQRTVLSHLSALLLSETTRPTYILRGFAGTGKTSLVSTLVKNLPSLGYGCVLLAPTGRAAKVIANLTGHTAYTIHHKIYRFGSLTDNEPNFILAENKSKNTLFVVDEASMISDDGYYHSLLDDLISYVFQGKGNKLLLIGDNAQLPPVGTSESPALDLNHMKSEYGLTVASYELTEVMRQSMESGILANATHIRNLLSGKSANFNMSVFRTKGFANIKKLENEDVQERFFQDFNEDNGSDSVIICKSNKRANMFNQSIRNRILNIEGEIATGDRLMVVKNNYFWKDNDNNMEFIANGDLLEIRKIRHFEEMYGFHFADVEVCLTDYENQPVFETKIILETLNSNNPALSDDEQKMLFNNVEEDYLDIPQKKERLARIKSNPWFNALQVKFAYALTCHKTQGGQWKNVYIDSCFNQRESLDIEDIRWLYTACTRAIEQLYLMGFKEDFFLD